MIRVRYLMMGLLVASLILLVGIQTGLTQRQPAGECSALVEQALAEIGGNCDALDRNNACYGFNRVDSTFFQEMPEDFFTAPSDRTGLETIQTLQTAPLDTGSGQWGVAVLRVQANVPNTLPGQAVVFLLVGDVAIENAVAPEDAVLPADPIALTTRVAANVRSGPGTTSNVVGSVEPGTALQADGLSADGAWLRVAFQERPAWISREVVEAAGDVTSLPAITERSRSPMQAFYFQTGVGDPACTESPPSLLVVQGPENIRVDLTVNGADINLGSTAVFWLLPGNQVQLIVVDGTAVVEGVVVPTGFTLVATVGEDGLIAPGSWGNFRAITEEEMGLLQPLENFPDSLFLYSIEIPDGADIAEVLAELNLANTVNTNTTQATNLNVGGTNCAGFGGTSPLGGMPYGMAAFYWDAAQGVTGYRVNVYNAGGGLVGSFETAAPNTSVIGDTSALGSASDFSFSWEVVALVNGQPACVSERYTMAREAAPPPSECGNGVCQASEKGCDGYPPSESAWCYADCGDDWMFLCG